MVIWSGVTPRSVPALLVPSAGPHGVGRSPKLVTVSEEPPPVLPSDEPDASVPRPLLPQATATMASTTRAEIPPRRFTPANTKDDPQLCVTPAAAGATVGSGDEGRC